MGEVDAVLLDVEGTTTPIEFVHGELFSYARAHLGDYLRGQRDTPNARDAMRELALQHHADELEGLAVTPWRDGVPVELLDSTIRYCLWLIDHDRKVPALKSLQGHVWEQGYRGGWLHGEVYSDVRPALQRWRREGLRIAIFSSGSVLSQRLLFAHSTAGDLTGAIDAYFDTDVGSKREPASFRRIVARLGVEQASLLFVSDTEEELDAAAAAGVRTALCARSRPAARSAHRVVRSFSELELELEPEP